MSKNDIESINITSGVNEKCVGFCTVSVITKDKRIFLGQLSPTKVREMALAWLEAAEAADQDAAVLRCVRKLELPDELAGAVVIELRNNRNE